MKSLLTFKPHLSEKAYQLSKSGVYVFEVPLSANKLEVIDALQKQYKVGVQDVKTMVSKGKSMRSYRKSGRSVVGTRSDFKKAYVTLLEGDRLSIFAADEEQDKPKPKAKAKASGSKE